jgi:anti-sigma B factor antagonist
VDGLLEPLALTVSVEGRLPAIARVSGELDLATVPLLTAALAEVDDGDVELDCSGLSFIDATGLRAFQIAHEACARRGCKLVLVDPSPALSRLVQMVGLESVFLFREAEAAS